MNIILQFALLALGFVMLVKGSDWFVDGAAGIAAKFRIPQIITRLTAPTSPWATSWAPIF